MLKFTGDLRRDFDKATSEITKQNDRIQGYQEKIANLRSSNKRLKESNDALKKKLEETISEKDAIIQELSNRLAHAEALLSHDSNNTGISTSQTPPGKNKRIPNSRQKSGKSKGGQPGHQKNALKKPDESEITDIVEHHPLEEGYCCPSCKGENCTPTGESDVKYEYDVRIKVVKIKHVYHYYECNDCGTVFRSIIPPHLKEEAQYGSGIQALALALTNTVNAAMNKTSMFLIGITGGELTPSDGYIAKLQSRAAKKLLPFREDLRKLLITRRIVYWDDTVIMVLKKRACFRFYGDETIAYYTAHAHKDRKSIEDDKILSLLTSDTFVMHDHNRVNYNEMFCFQNIECNQHVERDCLKNSNDTGHKWSTDLKKHIGTAIKDRNHAIKRGEDSFDQSYIEQFHKKVSHYLSEGWKENEKDSGNYGASFERSLLRRIEKYRSNYFQWLTDFRLPTTNNLSERGLRSIKSHMKISGQFESVKAADNHALIRTYVETCRRNNINENHALQRLCMDNPYTVKEIFL